MECSVLNSTKDNYKKYIKKKLLIIAALFVVTIGLIFYAINSGSFNLSISEIIGALIGQDSNNKATAVLNIRLPRILMAIISGMGLGVAGCVMQSILKNPLASASTLGVSQGAAFGAAIAITLFGAGAVNSTGADALNISSPYIVSICAFIGSMGATIVILFLSKYKKITPESMVLAGVALSSLFSGGTALIQYFADDVELATIVFWTFGDLGRANYKEIIIVTIITICAMFYFVINSWNYNALENGEQTAKGLGVNVNSMRLIGMVVCSMVTATIVSFVGIINFIGLIAPHIMRNFIGNDYRYLLPASAIMGGLLLLLSDTFARTIISPIILPIGAITSFMGAPLFLYILFKGGAKK